MTGEGAGDTASEVPDRNVTVAPTFMKGPHAMDEPDLLDLLDEQENGPAPCPHVARVGPRNGDGWVWEDDESSPYYAEWVHSAPYCRRSAIPGRKQFRDPAR